MTVSAEQVAKRCGANTAAGDERVLHALAYAEAEVAAVLEDAWRPMPDVLKDECVLRVAYSVFKRASALDGGNMLSADGTGVPGVANDPLRTSWPLLKRYINRV